jgi:hypothetical protein
VRRSRFRDGLRVRGSQALRVSLRVCRPERAPCAPRRCAREIDSCSEEYVHSTRQTDRLNDPFETHWTERTFRPLDRGCLRKEWPEQFEVERPSFED